MPEKIVTNGSHAVDVSQIAAIAKTGCANRDRWMLEIFFISGHASAPMDFPSEAGRDAFFADIVAAMEK